MIEATVPVPLAPFQKEVLAAIVDSHYNEILLFLETGEFQPILTKMIKEMQQLLVHPWLLVPEYSPSVKVRESPARIALDSGKFMAIAQLVTVMDSAKCPLDVAIVAKGNKILTMLENLLSDRPVTVGRYTRGSLKLPKVRGKHLVHIHLLPSEYRDFGQAVDCAFDLMIVLDDLFDLNDVYGSGLRRQLRDPARQLPLAPVLRLVVPNTVDEMRSMMPANEILNSADKLLPTLVNIWPKAGILPEWAQQLVQAEYAQLSTWFAHPDAPWPLPALEPVTLVTLQDACKVLMSEGTRVGLEDLYEPALAVLPGSNPSVSIKKEEISPNDKLLHAVLAKYSECFKQNEEYKKEISSHRSLANDRQTELEHVQSQMDHLVRDNASLKRQNEKDEFRVAKYRKDSHTLREQLQETRKEWAQVATAPDSEETTKGIRAKLHISEDEITTLNKRIGDMKNQLEFTLQEYRKARNTLIESQQSVETLEAETLKLRNEADSKRVELAAALNLEAIKEKDIIIARLQTELKETREFIAVFDPQTSGRDRGRGRGNNPRMKPDIERD